MPRRRPRSTSRRPATGCPTSSSDALITLDSGEHHDGQALRLRRRPRRRRRATGVGPPVLVGLARRRSTSGPTATAASRSPRPTAFRGPGAVLVEVTTATDENGNEDTTTTDDGATVLLSIPVQVGDDKPELRVPLDGRADLGRPALRPRHRHLLQGVHPRPARRRGPGLRRRVERRPSTAWTSAAPDGSVVAVTAADSATQGGEAVLTVRAGDSNTEEVRFRLAQAPPPTHAAHQGGDDGGRGEPHLRHRAPTSRPGWPTRTRRSCRSTAPAAPASRATANGSRLTLYREQGRPWRGGGFRLVVSDVDSSDPPAARRAEGRIQFQVVGVPSAPGEPRPYPVSDESGTIKMSWAPPDDDGGAPILYYVVKEERKGARQRCDTNECVFRKLENGGNYNFRVRRVNRVGAERVQRPVAARRRPTPSPGRVAEHPDGRARATARSRSPGTSRHDDVADPRLHDHLGRRPGRRCPATSTTLHRDRARQQREVRLLRQGAEQGRLLRAPVLARAPAARHAAARRPRPPWPTSRRAPNQTDMRIAWQAVLPEGPGPTVYTVTYTNGVTAGGVPGCQRIASLTCTHAGVPYDGLTYTYTRRGRQPAGRAGNRRCPARARRSRPSAGPPRGARSRWSPPAPARRPRSPTRCPTPAARPARSTSWSPGLVNKSLQPADRRERDPHLDAEQRAAVRRPAPGLQREGAGRLHAQRRAERADLRPARRELDESGRRSSTAGRSPGRSPAPATATPRSRRRPGQQRGRRAGHRPAGSGGAFTFDRTSPPRPTTTPASRHQVPLYDDAPAAAASPRSRNDRQRAPPDPGIGIGRGRAAARTATR